MSQSATSSVQGPLRLEAWDSTAPEPTISLRATHVTTTTNFLHILTKLVDAVAEAGTTTHVVNPAPMYCMKRSMAIRVIFLVAVQGAHPAHLPAILTPIIS